MSDNLNQGKPENDVQAWECDACGADVSFGDAFCRTCGADISEAANGDGTPTIKRAFTPLERKSIIACCGLSLLLFFFPLLTIHVPIAGDQDVSGYGALSKLSEFRALTSSNTPSSDTPHTVDRAQPSQRAPLSVQIAWLMPTALTLAFLSAAAALIASFKDVEVTRTVCIIGVCSSAVAILHIAIMNSDIQSWLSESMNTARTELKDNPFAGLAPLLANAFQIRPGWGLYALLVLLSVAAVLGSSRVLSRLRIE